MATTKKIKWHKQAPEDASHSTASSEEKKVPTTLKSKLLTPSSLHSATTLHQADVNMPLKYKISNIGCKTVPLTLAST